jgi:hypothetical protein
MAILPKYLDDYEKILSHRFDLGSDYWTTPDKRIIKGSPFSMLESLMYLYELGVEPSDSIITKSIELLFTLWKNDGRFKVTPQGVIYPCHTINTVNVLCHMGYVNDPRVQKTLTYLLDTQSEDGGWKCNKYSYGHGLETVHSNPFPTLVALNAFRFSKYINNNSKLDQAVLFLLEHWDIRKPIGPCHYGIGTLFMQVEYPFRTYNLFYYVYVLSFYEIARKDKRFLDALEVLTSKLQHNHIVIERVPLKMSNLTFCKKTTPSELATQRYMQIINNLSSE